MDKVFFCLQLVQIIMMLILMLSKKLYIPVVTLSVEDNQALSNFLPKDLKDHFIGIII